MSWRDPNWQYSNSTETAKPGYLRRKFKRIERDARLKAEAQAAADAEAKAKVAPIGARKTART
jgi:hypothetical protein